MRDDGKVTLLGIGIDQCDYEGAVERIVSAARQSRPLAVSALASHGVVTGVGKANANHRWRLNHLDLVTPDGQPVRWALNLLYGAGLTERVYGATLTELVLARAAMEKLPVYFYGSTPKVLEALVDRSANRWPNLVVAGSEPSQFRCGNATDVEELATRIHASGACITFVGLGCPRQEVMAYELRQRLRMPILAVGAAFDYHAGLLRQPPAFVQRYGLQWLYRLLQEPRRLWRRYLLDGTKFVVLVAVQRWGRWHPDDTGVEPPADSVISL
jgi:exopolysaccharide biosynthesis WecB/TagA/CpsF family protein